MLHCTLEVELLPCQAKKTRQFCPGDASCDSGIRADRSGDAADTTGHSCLVPKTSPKWGHGYALSCKRANDRSWRVGLAV